MGWRRVRGGLEVGERWVEGGRGMGWRWVRKWLEAGDANVGGG